MEEAGAGGALFWLCVSDQTLVKAPGDKEDNNIMTDQSLNHNPPEASG